MNNKRGIEPMMNSLKLAWKSESSLPRVVIASSSAAYRKELAAMCRPHFKAKPAKNLHQVLNLGSPRSPEILVLDEEFPILDDVPALTRIRLHPSFRTVPIIFTTEADVSIFLRRELASCNTAILGKPIDQSRLLSMVCDFVDTDFEVDRRRAG
ncbi:MAG: hypothetical protein MI741_24555 [Rhodospirillales bacterium]|nr:hypothetical protein [Rhodospirillales bacterium]